MKDHLAELVQAASSPLQARNVLREYLQARILGSLQRSGAMVYLAFQGGTALRFLYGLPRHSEDLDFTLERRRKQVDLRRWVEAIRSELAAEGYEVRPKIADGKAVHNAFVRFPGLLHEMDLSGHPDEAVAVKIEVDTNPPAGAVLETTVVRRHITLQLQHHDQASLLAGKLHAILHRPYAKGRDLYDLLWYLGDRTWPAPNLALLNNALHQTGWEGEELTAESLRAVVRERLRGLDWKAVRADVEPFLENAAEAELLTEESLLRLLR